MRATCGSTSSGCRSGSGQPSLDLDSMRISYSYGDGIYVLTVASGSTTKVADGGGNPEWMDDHTLVVGNATN